MDLRVTWAIEEMKRRIAEPLRIADLASGAHLSPSRFAHLFRSETGCAPGEFLRALRMTQARALLERSFLTVKEVMTIVGCNDASHFARDFRRFHGMAPRAWRTTRGAGVAEEDDAPEPTATFREIAASADERQDPPSNIARRRRAVAAIVNSNRIDNTDEEH